MSYSLSVYEEITYSTALEEESNLIYRMSEEVYLEFLSVMLVSPLCKANSPYYIVICGVSGCTIILHYLINDTVIGKELLNIKCVFRFSL